MPLAVFLLLLWRVAASQQDLYNNEHTSTLDGRIGRLERLLLFQDAKLSRQESLLRQQDNLIRQQEHQLSHQDMLLHQHEEKMSRQEMVNRQQEAELARQDTLLSQCGSLLHMLRDGDVGSRSLLSSGRTAHDQLFALKEWTLATPQEIDTAGHSLNETDNDLRASISSTHNVVTRADDLRLETVVDQVSQRMTELSAEVEALKNSNVQRDQDLQDARTSTFVHWGSSSCSDSSQLVYTGLMGGSWYLERGAATNVLCLTMDPVPRNLG